MGAWSYITDFVTVCVMQSDQSYFNFVVWPLCSKPVCTCIYEWLMLLPACHMLYFYHWLWNIYYNNIGNIWSLLVVWDLFVYVSCWTYSQTSLHTIQRVGLQQAENMECCTEMAIIECVLFCLLCTIVQWQCSTGLVLTDTCKQCEMSPSPPICITYKFYNNVLYKIDFLLCFGVWKVSKENYYNCLASTAVVHSHKHTDMSSSYEWTVLIWFRFRILLFCAS